MKFFYSSSLRLAVIALVAGLLGSCGSLQSLQDRFAADPKLTENPPEKNAEESGDRELRDRKSTLTLPEDFPTEIPQLPEAQLISVDEAEKITTWKTSQSVDNIANFYEDKLESDGWQILKSFPSPSDSDPDKSAIASREDLEITIEIEPNKPNQVTNFSISYRRNGTNVDSTTDSSQTATNSNRDTSAINNNTDRSSSSTVVSYNDLDTVPEGLRPYVKEVVALGAIVNYQNSSLFEPNKAITRREFARWLVLANNAIYSHRPSQQVRLANSTQKSIFKDISTSDPDFVYIQGLAQAGIIPSSLTGDTTQILFRPDAPLTREDAIAWKVPLDIRRSLPTASIDAIRQTWGFEDTAKIDPTTLRALYADFQNGENSNLRRIFGYTILFQPKKTVTRAEAVASFWYFGYQGDGISAEEALKIKN